MLESTNLFSQKSGVISFGIILISFLLSYAIVAHADNVSTQVIVGNATPSVTSAEINGSTAITLTENTTTVVEVTATVSDANGCENIESVMADFYRNELDNSSCDTAGEAVNNYCYPEVVCTVDEGTCTGGSDTSADYTCSFSIQYYADATDGSSPYSAQAWEVTVEAGDGTASSTDTDTEEINTLLALSVTSSIDYGTLSASADSGATNETTTVTNTGNSSMDPEISGTQLSDGGSNTIAVGYQEYSASSFTYGAGTDLTGSGVAIDLTLPQAQSTTTPITDDVLWGIGIPGGQTPATYTGTNTFTAATAQ